MFGLFKRKPDPERLEMEKWWDELAVKLDEELKDYENYNVLETNKRIRIASEIVNTYFFNELHDWNTDMKKCHINTPEVCIAVLKKYFKCNEYNRKALIYIFDKTIKNEKRKCFKKCWEADE